MRFAWTSAALVACLMAVAPKALETVARVHDGRPFCQVMALDLIGMCVLDPSIESELDYTRPYLAQDYRDRYEFGDVGPILFASPPIVKAGYVIPEHLDSLAHEYRRTIGRHPWRFLEVKWRAFLPLLGFERTLGWFEAGICSNDLGLVPNETFAGPRAAVVDLASRCLANPVARWVSAVHGLWLAVATVVLLWSVRRRHASRHAAMFTVSLACCPLLYAASYLAATPTPAFRFMYPSMLLVQAVVLVLLLGGFAEWRVRQRRPCPTVG